MSTRPRAVLAVFAMARPCRPAIEIEAVRAAAAGAGSVAKRAAALAKAVAIASMAQIDQDPADRLVELLKPRSLDAVEFLATDAEIGTSALIIRERVRRLEARGGRRLQEWEWRTEDRHVIAAVVATLSERYARHLRAKKCA